MSPSYRPSSGASPPTRSPLPKLYLGPPPPSGQAKVATHHYQVRTTRLDTRPDLPLLYGPSLGRQPADSEPNARLYRHVRAVITNSATRDNGQPPIPICIAALPDLPLLNGPSPPQDRLRYVITRPDQSLPGPAAPVGPDLRPRVVLTRKSDGHPIEGTISQDMQSPTTSSCRALRRATRRKIPLRETRTSRSDI